MVGALQSSSVESRFLASNKKTRWIYEKFYKNKFSWWRILLATPILAGLLASGLIYIFWVKNELGALVPEVALFAVYLAGGFLGYFLRKRAFQAYASRNV